ncbi:MAG: TfoX/Sxy family protein [Thermoplasmata archaeon]|nr:TfoX/Sxy family protein [Thermoplasmata archaeon]
MPKPAAETVAAFDSLVPKVAGVTRRLVFGQPAVFVDGNMFFSVFGNHLIVRLSEADRASALKDLGAIAFEPMPGRPMREYVELPTRLLADLPAVEGWVNRALEYGRRLPKKSAK